MRRLPLFTTAALLFTSFAFAQIGEKNIQRSELPSAVQKAAEVESKGATVRGFAKETEKNHTYYEMELTINDHHKDVLMDGDGTVVEVEEQVTLDSLQPQVRQALHTKAGNGVIKTVESLTKRGKLVAYEAQILTGKKRSEIQVGPTGADLKNEQ